MEQRLAEVTAPAILERALGLRPASRDDAFESHGDVLIFSFPLCLNLERVLGKHVFHNSEGELFREHGLGFEMRINTKKNRAWRTATKGSVG